MGRSYLIDHDGYLFQAPISWYAQKNLWDLSPHLQNGPYEFDRRVRSECLFCHCNSVKPVANTINRYQQPVFRGHAIGCERRHGPGELHVQRYQTREPPADPDDTIVNPGKLDPALREAVCQQCHLSALTRIPRRGKDLFDFRPGLPLQSFLTVFVPPAENSENHKFVSQVEQMYVSRCFRASGGQPGCISCHDPHRLPAPEKKAAFYRRRCLNCHQETRRSLDLEVRRRQDAEDRALYPLSHAAPDTSNVAHSAATDHRIPRQPGAKVPAAEEPKALLPGVPLVPFYQDRPDHPDQEMFRDLGLAVIQGAEHGSPGPTRMRLAQAGHAVAGAGGAQAAGGRRGLAGLRPGALVARPPAGSPGGPGNGAGRAPDQEDCLVNAATVSAELGLADASAGYWRRALAVDPWSWQYHMPPRLGAARASRHARGPGGMPGGHAPEPGQPGDPLGSGQIRSARRGPRTGPGRVRDRSGLEAGAPGSLAALV